MDKARPGLAFLQGVFGSSSGRLPIQNVQKTVVLLGHPPLARSCAEAYGRLRTSPPARWHSTEGEAWRAQRFSRPPSRAARRARPAPARRAAKKNAIGFVSSVVIGVASTAPGYSLAATLGFIAAAVALQSPAILLISFIPMFLVAAGYYYMNKADPDCGTSFSWVTTAMKSSRAGWPVGDRRRRRDRDGEPGPDRRAEDLPGRSAGAPPPPRPSPSPRSACCGSS